MFTDHTDYIKDNPAQSYYGAAITDLDGDGEFELVVASNGGDNLALKVGSNGFENIADKTLADRGCQAIGLDVWWHEANQPSLRRLKVTSKQSLTHHCALAASRMRRPAKRTMPSRFRED